MTKFGHFVKMNATAQYNSVIVNPLLAKLSDSVTNSEFVSVSGPLSRIEEKVITPSLKA